MLNTCPHTGGAAACQTCCPPARRPPAASLSGQPISLPARVTSTACPSARLSSTPLHASPPPAPSARPLHLPTECDHTTPFRPCCPRITQSPCPTPLPPYASAICLPLYLQHATASVPWPSPSACRVPLHRPSISPPRFLLVFVQTATTSFPWPSPSLCLQSASLPPLHPPASLSACRVRPHHFPGQAPHGAVWSGGHRHRRL